MVDFGHPPHAAARCGLGRHFERLRVFFSGTTANRADCCFRAEARGQPGIEKPLARPFLSGDRGWVGLLTQPILDTLSFSW
jgi:hypothetical protein